MLRLRLAKSSSLKNIYQIVIKYCFCFVRLFRVFVCLFVCFQYVLFLNQCRQSNQLILVVRRVVLNIFIMALYLNSLSIGKSIFVLCCCGLLITIILLSFDECRKDYYKSDAAAMKAGANELRALMR
jgi:hypothetical protein